MTSLCRLALTGAAMFLLSFPLFSQNFPEVLAVREIVLKADTDTDAYIAEVNTQAAALRKHGDGINMSIWKGDRGERSGALMFAWTFQSRENRDFYFPATTDDGYANFTALAEKAGVDPSPEDPRIESGMDTYTDYVVVGYDLMKNPKMGELLAIRPLEVKPGNEEAFEKIVKEVMVPLSQKAVKGAYRYILKGDRGERAGKYLLVDCYETVQVRDGYFPSEGGDTSESYTKQTDKLPDLSGKIGPLMKEGPTTYTDYILLK